MRLLDLTLRRVRRHRELQLALDPGLTLIGGANESGKSTLVEALHKGLFLKATATGRGVEELRSRLHPGLPEVEIGFEAAGHTWRLRKRFAGSSGTCQLSHGGGLNLSGGAAEEQLAQLLGVEGAVEGRRIAQLPLRWAHLWVRQGEAGSNLLAGPAEAYDLGRLIEQLQRGEAAETALESGLDRRVIEGLQRQLELQFTATGKVRAGSPLAQASQRQQRAQEQLEAALALRDQLEHSLEDLQQIEERLRELEQHQAPALEQQRRRQAERQLQQAELKPLQQRLQQLQQARADWQLLRQQLQQRRREQEQLQQQGHTHQQQLAAGQQQIEQLSASAQQWEQQLAQLAQQRQLVQLLLDQEQLQRDQAQRQQHQREFAELQAQAEAIKAQLARLPAIGTAELAQLRQAQLQLAQAEARRQASATSVELLAADQPVQLAGQPLLPGQPAELLRSDELQVGEGVRLRISPGGGEAPQQAQAHWQACLQAFNQLLEQLGVADLAQAEAACSQRLGLEAELQRLRQAASAIPWARLQQEQAEQQQRQQRLSAALAPYSAELEQRREQDGGLPGSRADLEQWRSALEAQVGGLERQRNQGQRQLEQLRQHQAERDASLRQRDQQLQHLAGELSGLEQRRAQLEQLHGAPEQLESEISQLEQACSQRHQALAELEQQLAAAGLQAGATAGDPELRLRQLQAEKDALLTRRGQQQQLILSLSAQDPAAAVEQAQAELEQAEAELQRQQQQSQALQLLLERFDQARRALSNRYSLPLGAAISRYLACLAVSSYEPGLDFEPNRGFGNLQLRQEGEGFGFEELSGGMREQLNGALRLAIAEVLKPAYDGCLPLVFDDAFTNSDPIRHQGLQRMLRQGLDQGLQILLLSCTPELYGPLLEGGGQMHQLEEPNGANAA
jgi:DNA repair exonuclease SbcCD ATPase subunit